MEKFCQHCGEKQNAQNKTCVKCGKTPFKNYSQDDTSIKPLNDKLEIINEKVNEDSSNIIPPPRLFASPFSFNGRIRRLEYGISFIIFIIVRVFLEVIVFDIPILGLLYIPAFWFFWAQGAKRCHDRGNSGWFQIIPFYGFWMLFAGSEVGTNRFGPNPKGLN